MIEEKDPGQGGAGMAAKPQPVAAAAFNVYAPPKAALDNQQFQPTIPIYLLIGFILVVVLLLFSMVSWFCVGFAHLVPLIVMLDMLPEVWLMMEYVHLLSTPLLISTAFAQGLGMAIWQGCSFASLRRAYGEGMVSRGWTSGIWWLVPVADLFIPLRSLRDFRYLIQRPRDRPDPRAPFGKTLLTLEVLLIITFLADVTNLLVETLTESADEGDVSDEEALETMAASVTAVTPDDILNIATSSVGIALAGVSLVIAIRYFLRQKELYAHWYDDRHWENQ